MRYTQQKALEKHLAASPLAGLYAVLSADDYERTCALDAVLTTIGADICPTRFLGAAEVKQVADALSTQSLFGGESVVLVDEAPAKTIESLVALKERLPGILLIGAKMKVSSAALDQHGVVLDLMEEKPWEKEKRWTEMLYEMAKAKGKRLLPDAAAWMIENLDQSTAQFAQEMEKLLCYAADRSIIERKDVEAICVKSRVYAQWQLAEELVWEKTVRISCDPEIASFHALLANVRTQLAMGAKMHALHERGVPYQEWGAHFPKIWPRALEKKAQAASRLGAAYFKQGLKLLFDLEMLAKSSSLPFDALYDLLRLRLVHAKS